MQNLNQNFQQSLNENEFKLFQKWLKGVLSAGEVTVIFLKKDGSERTMKCTTSDSLVPQEPIVENAVPKKEKKQNDDVCPVYDIEAQGWRSFRWDSVKEVKLSIGQ